MYVLYNKDPRTPANVAAYYWFLYAWDRLDDGLLTGRTI
jgi:hypothetical protein